MPETLLQKNIQQEEKVSVELHQYMSIVKGAIEDWLAKWFEETTATRTMFEETDGEDERV